MRYRTLAFLALSILAAACTPPPPDAVRTGPATPGESVSMEAANRRNRNRITAEELEELRSNGATDMYALIQRARPQWLRVRQAQAFPLILYNDRRLTGPRDLGAISSEVVESIEYISPPASRGRYGTSGEFGVIIIRGG